MNEGTMNVTWIDPDRRALYVAEQPDGKYGVWAQKDAKVPQKLRGGSLNPDGYLTFEEAQEALSQHVSHIKSAGPSSRWYGWEIIVNGKRVTEDEYHRMCCKELAIPAQLPPNAPVTLANIEYRIALHIQGAYDNVLEVGRCLNEAKDSELVPHGEWEGWVKRNTDMTERQAQRLMQAARSVSSGSMMERLPITKIQAILALPEPEREPMAKKAEDEGMSLRELQAEVKTLTRRLEMAKNDANAYLEQKRSLETTEINLRDQLKFRAVDVQTLKNQLADAQKATPAEGISAEAQAEIDRLKTELADAEEYAEKQAELRAKAQRELLERQAQEARGEVARDAGELTYSDLAAAVREFIGKAGALPLMGGSLAMLTGDVRGIYLQQLSIVRDWVDRSCEALSVVVHEYVVDGQVVDQDMTDARGIEL